MVKSIIGAIIGDIVGSRFEWMNNRSTEFDFFTEVNKFTDDTVMTCAVADWLVNDDNLAEELRLWANKYPKAGYGGKFREWVFSKDILPAYNSYGNGSAMRVSPVGFYAQTLNEAMELAKRSAEVTHNHPDGIEGAQAIASAIFLARAGKTKDDIREFIMHWFLYDLDRTIDEIRSNYKFDATCQGSVSEAIIAFLESTDFESAIRLAISIGGDSDTIACMAGGIAAAYYGVPHDIVNNTMKYLKEDVKYSLMVFNTICDSRSLVDGYGDYEIYDDEAFDDFDDFVDLEDFEFDDDILKDIEEFEGGKN